MDSVIIDIQSRGVDKLTEEIKGATKATSDLDKTLENAQKQLDELPKGSKAFNDLEKEIKAASIAATTYAQNSESLKREFRGQVEEIGKLERVLNELDKSGLKNSQTFKDLAKKQQELKNSSGELKDKISDLSKEIATAGSDTKKLDKTIRVLGSVAAGYQVAQGALSLFGGENEKFEKALLKLNAVMAISNGLQQIQEELSKKDSIFTLAATAAKKLYTKAIGDSTGAMKLLNHAFLFSGIGALIIGIITLISNFDSLTASGGYLGKTLSSISDIISKSIQAYKDLSDAIGLTDFAAQKAAEAEKARQLDVLDDLERNENTKISILKIQHKNALEEELKQLKRKRDLAEKANLQAKTYISEFNDKDREDRKKALKDIIDDIKIKQAEIDQYKLDAQTKSANDLAKKQRGSSDAAKKEAERIAKEKKDAAKKLADELSKINLESAIAEDQRQNKYNQKNYESYLELLEKKQAEAKADADFNNQLLVESLAFQLKANAENLVKLKNSKDKANIDAEQRRQDEKTAEIKLRDDRITIAAAAGNALFSIANSISETKKNILDAELASGLISQKKYNKELAKIKRQEAIQRKIEAAFNIGISIAESISKALTAGPIVGQVLAGITAALGLVQLGFVLAQPIPQFRHGGKVKEHGLLKGKSHEQGGVLIEAERDEYFMPTKQTQKYYNHLESMRKGNYDDFIQKEKFDYVRKLNTSLTMNTFSNIPRTDMIPKNKQNNDNGKMDLLIEEVKFLRLAVRNMDNNNVNTIEKNTNALKYIPNNGF